MTHGTFVATLGRRFREHRRARLIARNPAIDRCVEDVREKRLTYLSAGALWDLAEAALRVERKGLPGTIVEAGCALGGSALVLARSKSAERPLLVFDAFGMIPPPSAEDGPDVWKRYETIAAGRAEGIGGDSYYGYQENLLRKVEDTFAEFGLPVRENGVRLVKGLYRDTLRLTDPVALAHVDCDWYESVLDCLREIEPRLVPGGTLVVDDYDSWSGCRKAVDEYFSGPRGAGYRFVRRNRLHIVRERA